MSNQRGRRSSEVSIGQYLINRLQDYGLRDVFGIPGDYVLSFYSMLEKSPINVWAARAKIARALQLMLMLVSTAWAACA